MTSEFFKSEDVTKIEDLTEQKLEQKIGREKQKIESTITEDIFADMLRHRIAVVAVCFYIGSVCDNDKSYGDHG